MLVVAFLLTSDTASGTGISVIKYLGALNNVIKYGTRHRYPI